MGISNDKTQELVHNIVFARYGRKAKNALDEALEANITLENLTEKTLQLLEQHIANPIKYNEFQIPTQLEENRDLLIPEIRNRIRKIRRRDGDDQKVELYKLFVDKNWLVKFVTKQWFILNAGLALEVTQVKEKLSADFKLWLEKEYNVHIGDTVVHRHVISNSERARLKQIGFPVPSDHWVEGYYRVGMHLIRKMVESNHECVGLLSDGSWTYNPKIYDVASDGKPYASFTFLKDDALVGDRFFLMTAKPGNDQENQYYFATGSKRRKDLVESGELDIDVYCIFYPRERLLKQVFI